VGDVFIQKGGEMGAGYANLRGKKEKEAGKAGTQRRRIQLKPS